MLLRLGAADFEAVPLGQHRRFARFHVGPFGDFLSRGVFMLFQCRAVGKARFECRFSLLKDRFELIRAGLRNPKSLDPRLAGFSNRDDPPQHPSQFPTSAVREARALFLTPRLQSHFFELPPQRFLFRPRGFTKRIRLGDELSLGQHPFPTRHGVGRRTRTPRGATAGEDTQASNEDERRETLHGRGTLLAPPAGFEPAIVGLEVQPGGVRDELLVRTGLPSDLCIAGGSQERVFRAG